MATIELTINKAEVWNEVAKTTNYTGDKSSNGDAEVFDRIIITDEDAKSLQRFWEEAVTEANDQLKEMLNAASGMSADYTVTLNVSSRYDTVLNASVQAALFSYFVAAIVGRWYKFANKGETAEFFADADAMMHNVLRKLYSRKAPTRPTRLTAAGRPSLDSEADKEHLNKTD